MIFSLNIKVQIRCYYLKNGALDFAFGFEALSHPSCYLTSIMDKTHHGPAIALFSVQRQQLQLFSYVGGILVINHFQLLLIDRYILAIQEIITHKEHLRYSF